MKELLHTTYIRLDTTSKVLSKIALSQFVLKIIYLNGPNCALENILSFIRQELKANVKDSILKDSLTQLKDEGKIRIVDNIVTIDSKCNDEITRAVNAHSARHDLIMAKYFSRAESNPLEVRRWFENVTEEYFARFSDDWISQILKKTVNVGGLIPGIHKIEI
jgi:hypothetical protein